MEEGRDHELIEHITALNQRFYDAIEGRDLPAMEALWEHSERVTCVHPGWTILRGWPDVQDSWRRILQGPGHNQFILTNVSVSIQQDTAWVVLDENLMTGGAATTVATVNIFVRTGEAWSMVTHHGAPVLSG